MGVLAKRRNTADDRFTARPKGATQMIQTGVAVLEKDLPCPADCALSWIIWVALSPSIQASWTTRSGSPGATLDLHGLDRAVLGQDLDVVDFAIAVDPGFSTDDSALVLSFDHFYGLRQGGTTALGNH